MTRYIDLIARCINLVALVLVLSSVLMLLIGYIINPELSDDKNLGLGNILADFFYSWIFFIIPVILQVTLNACIKRLISFSNNISSLMIASLGLTLFSILLLSLILKISISPEYMMIVLPLVINSILIPLFDNRLR